MSGLCGVAVWLSTVVGGPGGDMRSGASSGSGSGRGAALLDVVIFGSQNPGEVCFGVLGPEALGHNGVRVLTPLAHGCPRRPSGRRRALVKSRRAAAKPGFARNGRAEGHSEAQCHDERPRNRCARPASSFTTACYNLTHNWRWPKTEHRPPDGRAHSLTAAAQRGRRRRRRFFARATLVSHTAAG